MATHLTIDPEFQDLLPDLTDDEKEGLRQSIIAEGGCHDPIIYWSDDPEGRNPILDGMHRFDVCNNEGLKYPTKGMSFPDRPSAMIWIFENQHGRRNMTPEQRKLVRGRWYNLKKAENPEKSEKGKFCPSGNTAENIAREEGVSARTVKSDGQYAAAAQEILEKAPDLKHAIEHGDIPAGIVPALATASASKLKSLPSDPKKLKKAAKALVKPPDQGKRAGKSKSMFDELHTKLGHCLRNTDDLNRVFSHGNLHRATLSAIKEAMDRVTEWKAAMR
ncbi:MAG: hypothetical protein V1755_06645 [Chloroflexota bacterium]